MMGIRRITLQGCASWGCRVNNLFPFNPQCLRCYFLTGSECKKLKPFTSNWDLNPCGPCQSPAWKLNPDGWDSKVAKTHCLVRSYIWFQDRMKLKLLMSRHRKNSVRDRVVGKKQIYLKRNAPQYVGHFRRKEQFQEKLMPPSGPWKNASAAPKCGSQLLRTG